MTVDDAMIESTLEGRSIHHRVVRAPTSHRVAALRQSRVRAHVSLIVTRITGTLDASPRARHPSRVPIVDRTPKIRSRAIRSMDASDDSMMTRVRSSRVESRRVERRTRPWKRCARRREPSSSSSSFVRSRVDMTTDRTVMRTVMRTRECTVEGGAGRLSYGH